MRQFAVTTFRKLQALNWPQNQIKLRQKNHSGDCILQ